jgi:hypothetical protein
MPDLSRIKEHMKVISSDNQLVGTVDCIRDEKIILTKSGPAAGGKHHWIPSGWVASVEEDKIRLNQTAEQARANWFDAEPDGHAESKTACP